MSTLPFHTLNTPSSTPIPSSNSTSFSLHTPSTTPFSPTDIWRKPGPPEIHTFNAPILYKAISLGRFQRMRVTVSGAWGTLYDQGGLVFVLPDQAGEREERGGKWIKSGIEYFNSEPYVSTVCCDRWADWSLVKTGLRPSSSSPSSSSTEVTIEFERNPLEGTLWIYVIDSEKRLPVREVTWVLSEGDERVAWVGVYAAKPTADEGEAERKGLQVNFTGWELDLR